MSQGSLLTDLNPAINPNKTIADPEDKKPEEWDEREKLAILILKPCILPFVLFRIFIFNV